MLTNMLNCLVFLFFLILPSHAFWWSTSSTEAPPPVVKQIPLTYFRTYTYQQPINTGALPFPLMSSTDYISNYGALGNTPYYNPMMPMMTGGLPNGNEIPMATRPAKSYAGVNVVRSLNSAVAPAPPTTAKTTTPEPTTSTTTTTTTTTTTPAPTTTTETPTTIEDSASATAPFIKADSLLNIETAYPAFNRKVFTNHFNINYNRPVYPYPEYSVYKPNSPNNPNINEENKVSNSPQASQPNVEFVPCMCPVNIQAGGAFQPGFQGGFQAGIPLTGNPSNSIFLAQGRTNADMEASMDLPMAMPADSVSEANLVDSLQIIKLDDEDTATENALS